MKIFFPIGAFYPCQIGGQASAVLWHVTALGKQNIECSVFTTLYGISHNLVQEEKVNSTEFGSVYYSRNPLSLTALKVIYKNLNETDLIHLSGIFNIPSTLTLIIWAVFFQHKKIICSVHGELNPNALQFSSWKKQPTLLLYRLLYKKILFHTTSNQEDYDVKKFITGAKTLQIPNLMAPADQIEDVEKKKQFLFMGRIHEIKSLHKFINALALSKLFKDSDFIFDITGTYEDRHQDYFNQLKKLITDLGLEKKVTFSGHIGGIEKEKKYAESYFLILPSETENFGNVVVEALNQKTPVLASLGTPWSILEDYNCGFHTDNSPQNLANYIDKIIQMDSSVYKQHSENAAILVNEKFNINTQISRWTDIYKNLAMKSNSKV